MLSRGILLLLLFSGFWGYSQSDLQLNFGVSPWQFSHHSDDLSSPVQLSYMGGIHYEQVINRGSLALLSGINYRYTPKGRQMTDMSDQENLLALIYEKEINEKFLNTAHHEIAVPLLMVFYHNGFRSAAGAEYNRYLYQEAESSLPNHSYNDYGLRVLTGARLSPRISFSLSYYYGLKKVLNLKAFPEGVGGKVFRANVQRVEIQLNVSVFNHFEKERYFLSSDTKEEKN